MKRSNKLNLVKVGILTVLSLGLYSIYLFYNNLKILREYSKKKKSKAFILLYFIPAIRYIFLYLITKWTADLIKADKKRKNKIQVLVILSFALLSFINRLPDFLSTLNSIILYTASMVFFIAVLIYYQKNINEFLDKKEKKRKYKVVYVGEIIFMLCIYLLVLIIGSMALFL